MTYEAWEEPLPYAALTVPRTKTGFGTQAIALPLQITIGKNRKWYAGGYPEC